MNHSAMKTFHPSPIRSRLIMIVLVCGCAGAALLPEPVPVSAPSTVTSMLPISPEQPLVLSSSALLLRHVMKKAVGVQAAPVESGLPKAVLEDAAELEERISRSLAETMEKALSSISTPLADICDSIKAIAASPARAEYSTGEVGKLHLIAVRLRNSLQYYALEKGCSSRDALAISIASSPDLVRMRESDAGRLKAGDVRSLRDFLLYVIFCVQEPMAWLNDIIEREILYVHHQCRTFELLRSVEIIYRAAAMKRRESIDRFLDEPKWMLWADDCGEKVTLAPLMRYLGVGGRLRDLPTQTRASNILAATRSLRAYLQQK